MFTTSRRNPVAKRSHHALIDAAIELLHAHDAAEISITQVVESAGVSRPTFYQHFPSAGALFAEAGLTRLGARFDGADIQARSADLEAGLGVVFAALIGRMSADAAFFARVHGSAGGAEFHVGAVAATADWLRSQEVLRDRAVADEAIWDFLAGGVVWIAIQHVAEVHLGAPPSRPHPEQDLARIVASMLLAAPLGIPA